VADDSDAGGVRGWLNKHPGVAIGAVAALLVIILAFWLWPEPKPQSYYTTDDGKTWFTADRVVPPFDKGGQEAVQAVMFSCDGGAPFVGYLRRYPPDAKARLEAHMSDPKNQFAMPPGGEEVKRPGDKEWVSSNSTDPGIAIREAMAKGLDPRTALSGGDRFSKITTVVCPGTTKQAIEVLPPE